MFCRRASMLSFNYYFSLPSHVCTRRLSSSRQREMSEMGNGNVDWAMGCRIQMIPLLTHILPNSPRLIRLDHYPCFGNKKKNDRFDFAEVTSFEADGYS